MDSKFTREYKRRYRIVTDSPHVDGRAVYEAAAILGLVPRIYDPYITPTTIDTGSLVTRFRCTNTEQHPRIWDADVEYSSISVDAARQSETPTLRPIDIAWRHQAFQRTYEAAFSKSFSNFPNQEITGASGGEELDLPVINSANDIYVPSIQDDDELIVLHIGKNVPAYSESQAYDFIGSCNSQPWFGGEAETWKCVALEGTLQPIENKTIYWRLETEFHYKYDNWRHKLQDRGRSELIDGKRRLIVDRGNNVINGNALLDGNGRELAVGADPIYIHYRTKRLRDFANLRLF